MLQDRCSVSLFDILVHLFPRAAYELRNLGDILDTPANGTILAEQIHSVFDRFKFCLVPWVSFDYNLCVLRIQLDDLLQPKENPEPNMYKVVKFTNVEIPGLQASVIKFEDHSHQHQETLEPPPAHDYHLRSGQQRPATSSGVALPNYLASAFAAVDLTPGMGSLTIH